MALSKHWQNLHQEKLQILPTDGCGWGRFIDKTQFESIKLPPPFIIEVGEMIESDSTIYGFRFSVENDEDHLFKDLKLSAVIWQDELRSPNESSPFVVFAGKNYIKVRSQPKDAPLDSNFDKPGFPYIRGFFLWPGCCRPN